MGHALRTVAAVGASLALAAPASAQTAAGPPVKPVSEAPAPKTVGEVVVTAQSPQQDRVEIDRRSYAIGKNLQADYGPARIRPALSGTDYFNSNYIEGDFGYYFFAGTQGRIVGQNIFLDGNSFRTSRNVTKKPLVGDLQAGFSVFTSKAFRVDFSVVRRTEEFQGQTTPDVIGTAALSFAW